MAYYAELLKANNERLNDDNFVMPYLDPNMRETTVRNLRRALGKYKFPKRRIEEALDEGFARLEKPTFGKRVGRLSSRPAPKESKSSSLRGVRIMPTPKLTTESENF